jgi:hypothetical protein
MIRPSVLVGLSFSCLFACSDAGDSGTGALTDAELSKRRADPRAGAPGAIAGGPAAEGGAGGAESGSGGTAAEASPRFVEGNPSSCAAAIPEAADLLTFKVDPAKSGTYTSSDAGVTVSIDASEKTFSFTSDVPLEWIIVKGGPGANIYTFSPPVASAEGLVAPDDKGLSHLDFCYPPPDGGEGGSSGAGSGGTASGGTSAGGTSTGGSSAGGTNTAGAAGEGTGGCPAPCQR